MKIGIDKYFETSCKSGENVEKLFDTIVKEFYIVDVNK